VALLKPDATFVTYREHPQLIPDDRPLTAESALAANSGEWFYALVDGVERGSEFLVMELEVIEPSLFFASAPGLTRPLARAIVERS